MFKSIPGIENYSINEYGNIKDSKGKCLKQYYNINNEPKVTLAIKRNEYVRRVWIKVATLLIHTFKKELDIHSLDMYDIKYLDGNVLNLDLDNIDILPMLEKESRYLKKYALYDLTNDEILTFDNTNDIIKYLGITRAIYYAYRKLGRVINGRYIIYSKNGFRIPLYKEFEMNNKFINARNGIVVIDEQEELKYYKGMSYVSAHEKVSLRRLKMILNTGNTIDGKEYYSVNSFLKDTVYKYITL